MSATLLLEDGTVLGTMAGELPREGDIIKIDPYRGFYRVTTIVWILEAHTASSPTQLYPTKLRRIFVEELEQSGHLLKALARVAADGL